MSVVPFVHLPIKEYRLKKDPRPRLDIQYLADYEESESEESEEEEMVCQFPPSLSIYLLFGQAYISIGCDDVM
jgi:hypothetical protein